MSERSAAAFPCAALTCSASKAGSCTVVGAPVASMACVAVGAPVASMATADSEAVACAPDGRAAAGAAVVACAPVRLAGSRTILVVAASSDGGGKAKGSS